jgi:putative flippase GtrA
MFFQFLRFALVGGVGTSAHFTILIILVSGLHIHPVLGSTAGFLVAVISNYILNKSFTFSSNRRHSETFWRFVIVALIGMTINSTFMALLTMGLNLHYLLAQIIATAMALSWNFFGSRHWVFRKRS